MLTISENDTGLMAISKGRNGRFPEKRNRWRSGGRWGTGMRDRHGEIWEEWSWALDRHLTGPGVRWCFSVSLHHES